MRRVVDLGVVCVVSMALTGCGIVSSLGASIGVWAATRSAEMYFLRETPTGIYTASRARAAAAVAEVLASVGVERASVYLEARHARVVEAILPIEGELVITLVPLSGNVTKVMVTARTGRLGPDIVVAKDILDRISRALEERPLVVSEGSVI